MTIITTVVIKPDSSGGSFKSSSYTVNLFSSIVINKSKALLNVMLYNYIILFLINI